MNGSSPSVVEDAPHYPSSVGYTPPTTIEVDDEADATQVENDIRNTNDHDDILLVLPRERVENNSSNTSGGKRDWQLMMRKPTDQGPKCSCSCSATHLCPLNNPLENQASSSPLTVKDESEPRRETMTLIFEKRLSASDVGDFNRLVLPRKFAEAHFPPLQTSPNEYKHAFLHFCDNEKKIWEMKFEYWPSSQNFALTRGWKRFVNYHGLGDLDVIRIYEVDIKQQRQLQQQQQQQQQEQQVQPNLNYYGIDHCHFKETIQIFGEECIICDPGTPTRNNEDAHGNGNNGIIRPNGDVINGIRPNGGIRRIRKIKSND